jgi:hypothetical protein
MYFTIEAIHNVGRPSSTSAIGLIFTPIHALFYGGVGLLIGVGLKRILLKIGVDFKTSALWLSIVSFTLIFLFCLLSAFYAKSQIAEFEKYQSPRVIKDSLLLTKEPVAETLFATGEKYSSAELLEYGGLENLEIDWNGNLIYAALEGDSGLYLENSENVSRTLDVSNFSYLAKAEIMPLGNYLIVLTSLRATSKRSMFFILNQDLKVVYQELLNRCVGFKDEQIYLSKTDDNIIVKACEPFKLNFIS